MEPGGLNPETALQLILMLLRAAAYFFAGFALLGLSTYVVFLCLEVFASQPHPKVRIAKAPQPFGCASVVEQTHDLVPAATPVLAEEATVTAEWCFVATESELSPHATASVIDEGVMDKGRKAGAIRFGKVLEILLCLAGLGVLAENVFLLHQNRRLEEALAPQITAGAHLQKLVGLGLDGRFQAQALPSADSKLLIITFSPACPACQTNQEGWMKLAGILEQKGVRVLWVSRDSMEITRDYCMKHGIRLLDVVADPPHRTYVQLGLARVPNTLLVGANGTVEKVWAGRLDQAGWDTMFAYFGEREETASRTRVEVGAGTTDCGSELSPTSVKGCK